MPGQPKRLDVLLAELLNDRSDDVLEILVVRRRPHASRREWRSDDEAVSVNVVQQREVVALPVSIRASAVQAEDEGDFLTWFQIAGIIQEVVATSLRLDDRPAVRHHLTGAILVGTVQDGRLRTGSPCKPNGLLLGAGVTGDHEHCTGDGERFEQIA